MSAFPPGHDMFVVGVREDGALAVETAEFKEFAARGRVPDCDCELIQCVCAEARQHKKYCRFRRSMTCAIPIDCDDHHFDVCPVCDPCTCEGPDLPEAHG